VRLGGLVANAWEVVRIGRVLKDGGGDEGGVSRAGIVSLCRQCGFELLGLVRRATAP